MKRTTCALALTLLAAATASHAGTVAKTELARTTNLYASSCTAARGHVPLSTALQIARNNVTDIPADRVEYFVRKGYEFAAGYPDVHCSQIYITIIDALVGAKS